MNAIVIEQTGGLEALCWRTITVPEPGPGEVLLRHEAIGLNYIDVYHRSGLYHQKLPFIPGVEGAGIVEAVGAGVTALRAGDRVAYAKPIGAYAERRVIAADQLVRVPEGISTEQAAAVLLQGMTAQMLLKHVTTVEPGDTILVHAAAGGVGLLLCQWAAALGVTVIGTVSTRDKAELARANGCHHPLVTGESDFVAAVNEITRGSKLPVVYDSVGAETFLRSLDCLSPRGLMISFGQSSGPVAPFSPLLLSEKGSLYLTRPTLFTYVAAPAALQASAADLFAAIEDGTLRVTIGQRYSLREADRAHADLEARRTIASTILIP